MTFDLKRLPVCGGRLPLLEDEDENLPLSASAATLLMLAKLMLPELQPLTFSMLAVLLWAAETRSPGRFLSPNWFRAFSPPLSIFPSLLLSLPPSDPSLFFLF